MRAVKTAYAVLMILILSLTASCDNSKKGENKDYSALSYETRTVNTRSTQISYLLISHRSPHPEIIIVLLPGGTGLCNFGTMAERSACGKDSGNSIEFSPDIWVSYNFLARTARDFAVSGFTVVLLDMPVDVKKQMPSDPRGPKIVASAYRVGGDWNNDSNPDQQDVVDDVSNVLTDVRGRMSLPLTQVYLVGTSRGSLASAYLSHRLTSAMGAVLTASVTSDLNYSSYCPSTSSDFISCTGINAFWGKVLMVHHRDDGCGSSTYSSAQTTYSSLATSSKTFTTVTGGSEVSSNPCKGKTYHGFYGRENDVVNLILDWIEGKSIPANL